MFLCENFVKNSKSFTGLLKEIAAQKFFIAHVKGQRQKIENFEWYIPKFEGGCLGGQTGP